MTASPRVLVLTLYAGENEFERSRESLRAQTLSGWEQRVFEFLPNKQAHEALQREVMERAGEFDLFVKLDADMVLRTPDALAGLAALFRDRPRTDHARTAVHDWFSDSLVMGLHVWSPRVRWERSDELLFVDTAPVYPGERLTLWSAPAPFADHCPDPDPHQAFFFGVHRALKALQSGRPLARFSYGLASGQWRILRATWAHFRRSGDRRLGLAVLGADRVLSGQIEERHVDAKHGAWSEVADELCGMSAEQIERELAPRWDRATGAPLRYFARVTPRRIATLPLEVWRKLRYGATS